MTETTNNCNYRSEISYTSTQTQIIDNLKNIILLEIQNMKLNNEIEIYNNHEAISNMIIGNFFDKKIINIMVLALTQSGKTGGMLSLIKNYLSHAAITIPTENIYIITGLSSQDWCEQTKGRIPASMRTRVFHRDELTSKFVDDIYEKENVLIIIDEVQIAAKENQTLHKAF